MSYPFITKKVIECVVLELGAIVTSYCQYSEVVLTLHLGGKVDEDLLSLILLLEKENPSIS
jgi:hypothetical protein